MTVPLILMADYFADPVWHRSADGAGAARSGMVDLDSLPLTAALKQQLRAWARRHDDELLPTEQCQWSSPDVEAAWIAQGQVLLELLRTELGPDYDVTYFHGPA
jgi:hypothetical protein